MDMPVIQQTHNRDSASSVNVAVPEAESFWGKDGFTFGDVVDMFNPLQHLPFVAKYYREHAEDDACEGSKLIGGALFGGLLGGAAGVLSSIANSAVRHETHHDVSEHLLEIADDSFDRLVEGSLSATADGSVHNIETAENRHEITSQSVAARSDTMNPFFAQILDEYSNEQSGFSSQGSVSNQRSREWGKV